MRTPENLDLLTKLVKEVSKSYSLDPNLVASFITVESGYDMWACRYEPNYLYLKNPAVYAKRLSITESTERNFQKVSWGLLQIMGATARGLGYDDHLPQLCLPEINLEYGCKLIATLIDRYHNIGDAISAYNAGTPKKSGAGGYLNQEYVDKVMMLYSPTRTMN